MENADWKPKILQLKQQGDFMDYSYQDYESIDDYLSELELEKDDTSK